MKEIETCDWLKWLEWKLLEIDSTIYRVYRQHKVLYMCKYSCDTELITWFLGEVAWKLMTHFLAGVLNLSDTTVSVYTGLTSARKRERARKSEQYTPLELALCESCCCLLKVKDTACVLISGDWLGLDKVRSGTDSWPWDKSLQEVSVCLLW